MHTCVEVRPGGDGGGGGYRLGAHLWRYGGVRTCVEVRPGGDGGGAAGWVHTCVEVRGRCTPVWR